MTIKFGRQASLTTLFLIGSGLSFGDSVAVPGQNPSQVWQSWDASQLNSTQLWQAAQKNIANNPYWNNLSWDGANKNVGFCLTGSSNCGVNPAPGALPYLGQANGKSFTDFYFNSNGGMVTATFDAQIAGDAQYDELGWYNVQKPSQFGVLFSGVTAAGATANFTPSAEYGLFLYNGASGIKDTFLSQSSSALSSDQGYQHFAVFDAGASDFFVGAEDLPSSNTDFDYNDMLVELSSSSPVTATPEPGAVALVATGLIGLGMFKFRRKKAVNES